MAVLFFFIKKNVLSLLSSCLRLGSDINVLTLPHTLSFSFSPSIELTLPGTSLDGHVYFRISPGHVKMVFVLCRNR